MNDATASLIKALESFPEQWALTPVQDKAPKIKNWQKGIDRSIIIKELEAGRANGIGLITGELSGCILAIDCDGHSAHQLAEKLGGLPHTVSFTSGKTGRAQHLYLVPSEYRELLKNFTRKVLETGTKGEQLEIRYNASQSVLPPSQHPETDGYKSINSIENTPIAEVPTWVIEKILDEKPEQPKLDFTQAQNLDPIPLIQCLSREHRERVLSGISQGGRNSAGAKLARDLIGTETRLQYLGIPCTDTARGLFDDYCDRCNPSINNRERETIWRSAQKDNPTPCLDDDKLENCYKAWQRNQRQVLINTSQHSEIPNRNLIASTPVKKKSTAQEIRQAVIECEKILLDVTLDDIDKAIKIEEIREGLLVSNTLWQDLLSKINRGVCEKRLNLELKALLQSEDKIKREIELSRIAQKYRLNLRSLEKMLREMEIRITTPEYESMDFEELYNMGSQAVDYLIPGLLPKGESVLLVAMPKVGKSLLAVDVAYAVATGEDGFLGETCATGRVLYVSVDESRDSVVKKMKNRGFRPCDKDSIRIVTTFSISQLPKLEAEIETFKPTLVIIDSLKRITKGLEISENSAEFSDNVYTISELCNRYGAACLLIHHSNKNTESIGVENVRGSTAIAGACGNTWILNRVGKEDPNNKKKIIYDPRDPKRQLFCFSRDSEGKTFSIELNPENNSWQLLGEMGIDEEEAERMKTTKTRILKVFELNQKHHPQGLSGSFIFDCLEYQSPGEITKGSMYTTLNRLVSDKIIGSKPAPGDKRYTLYFLPGYGQDYSDPPKPSKQTQPEREYTTNHQPDSTVEDSEKSTIPPLPPLNDSDVMQYAEITTQYGLQIDNNSQKLDNKYITPVDEKSPMLCTCNSDTEEDAAHYITNNNSKGGGVPNNQNGEEPKHITSDVCSTIPEQTQPTMDNGTPEPQIKAIYIDVQGFPHKIIERDDSGRWRDQHGDNITPGVFRTYKPWKTSEVTQLLDQISEAMQAFNNSNTAPITELLTNPITKAKINVIKGSIKNHIGTDTFNKLHEYAKSLKKQS